MTRTRKYYLKNNYLTRSMIFGMWVHDHKVVCCIL
jgi:hypothetical protein